MRTMSCETKDMEVWTRFQTALAFTDVAVLYSQVRALEAHRRLGWGMLRWEESANAVTVGMILLIRIGFAAGVGFGKGGATKKRASEISNLMMQKTGLADFARDASRSGDAHNDQRNAFVRVAEARNGCKPIIRLSSQWYPSGVTSQSPFRACDKQYQRASHNS